MTAENSYRDFFRNNQTEMKCEMEVADCNAQGDTKKVCMIHDTTLVCINIPGSVLCT